MTPAALLTNELLVAISNRFRNRIAIWRNNRIDTMAAGAGGKLRRISAGIDGQADLTGLMFPSGRRIEIEIKAGRDRQSAVQRSFQLMIEGRGGVYLICRDVAECIRELERIM